MKKRVLLPARTQPEKSRLLRAATVQGLEKAPAAGDFLPMDYRAP